MVSIQSPVRYPNRALDHYNVPWNIDDSPTSAFTQYSDTYPVQFIARCSKSSGAGNWVRVRIEIADDALGTNAQDIDQQNSESAATGQPVIASAGCTVPPGKFVRAYFDGTPSSSFIRWLPIA